MGVLGQLDTPAGLPLRQEAQYTSTRSLADVKDLCQRFGGERNVFPLSGYETLFVGHAIHISTLF
jgi:hypothetical protein